MPYVSRGHQHPGTLTMVRAPMQPARGRGDAPSAAPATRARPPGSPSFSSTSRSSSRSSSSMSSMAATANASKLPKVVLIGTRSHARSHTWAGNPCDQHEFVYLKIGRSTVRRRRPGMTTTRRGSPGAIPRVLATAGPPGRDPLPLPAAGVQHQPAQRGRAQDPEVRARLPGELRLVGRRATADPTPETPNRGLDQPALTSSSSYRARDNRSHSRR
jgi:hypothetical protein